MYFSMAVGMGDILNSKEIPDALGPNLTLQGSRHSIGTVPLDLR